MLSYVDARCFEVKDVLRWGRESDGYVGVQRYSKPV